MTLKLNILFALLITHCTMRQCTNEQLKDCNNTEEQTTINPQKEICIDTNKTNINGKKQGLWITKEPYRRIEEYYKNGVLSGVYKEFNSIGDLLVFGEYTDGKMFGKWYYYDCGHLITTFENFTKNYDTITNEGDKRKYVPDYKCQSKYYYSNGNIKEEGWLLWSEGENPDSDFSVEDGTWKYYDEKGNLIKTKEYKP